MIRVFAIAVAVALIGFPAILIYAITFPAARSRTGSYVDFLAFVGTLFAIYGGVVLGIAVPWSRAGRVWQRVRPVEAFKAGVWGAVAVGTVFIVGAGVHGLMTRGSFEKGIGNLWGLVLIFAALLGALVSAGVGLLLSGVRPLAGAGEPGMRSGRS